MSTEPENPTRRVALYLDEDDRARVEPIDDDAFDMDVFDSESTRFADVPAALVDGLAGAWAAVQALGDAIFAAAGVDPSTGRRALCNDWRGEVYTSPTNERVYYLDCAWCGHAFKAHAASSSRSENP